MSEIQLGCVGLQTYSVGCFERAEKKKKVDGLCMNAFGLVGIGQVLVGSYCNS